MNRIGENNMSSLRWSDYTSEELTDVINNENPVVIVTVGATEQHGPHLPLNTDTDIGYQLALHLAKHAPIKTLVLPPVWTGFSPHHMDFTGTITISQSTLFHLVFDIMESLIKHGITRILLLNSHGGNIALLKTVADEIAIKYKVSPIYVTYWQMISNLINDVRKSELGGMSHACELETSLKMVFSPDEVRINRIQDVSVKGNEFHHVDMFAANKISMYRPFTHWTETGQIGEPSKASKETGEKLLELLKMNFYQMMSEQWQ
jgi:creatinine amidohydrolase